ncbi:MAG: hypothetical protein ABFE07_00385 [Armatimonadia bacterium]
MSVYKRYFEIKDAATLAKIDQILADQEAYNEGLKKIKEDICATQVFTYSRSGRLAGFAFASPHDLSDFKRVGGAWLPKKNTSVGRAIWKQINRLKCPGTLDDALSVSGIFHELCLTDGSMGYGASICGSKTKKRWFAVVPWRDVDPKEMEQYKADNAAGNRYCAALDHLQWVPPAEWVEMKEWQLLKAMDELKGAA